MNTKRACAAACGRDAREGQITCGDLACDLKVEGHTIRAPNRQARRAAAALGAPVRQRCQKNTTIGVEGDGQPATPCEFVGTPRPYGLTLCEVHHRVTLVFLGSVLEFYCKAPIDPGTARGLADNDAGERMDGPELVGPEDDDAPPHLHLVANGSEPPADQASAAPSLAPVVDRPAPIVEQQSRQREHLAAIIEQEARHVAGAPAGRRDALEYEATNRAWKRCGEVLGRELTADERRAIAKGIKELASELNSHAAAAPERPGPASGRAN